MSETGHGAEDLLGVAVQALREIAGEDDITRARRVAESAMGIVKNRFTGDSEWKLVSRTAEEPQEPERRYALVEQMGHRSTTGTVTETTFAGRPMLAVTNLATGREHLVSPDSLYEITWLTEDEARQRARPWTAAALPVAGGDDADDDDESPRGEDGDYDKCEPTL